MDWLDEKAERLTKWVRNLSLRKALAVYIIICVLVVGTLYAVTMSFCDSWDRYIWDFNVSTVEIGEQGEQFQAEYSINQPRLTLTERIVVNIIDFIQSWSIFIYSLCGIIGFSLLFYNHKLRQPLRILRDATGKVGSSDLDFEINYDCRDEMGELCRSFDLMRRQLIMNNQKMWDMMEEQKRLNAAFAHDLRTPLTVLRGYTDFLREYIPEGRIAEDKMLATLSTMSGHIERLERYSNTMKEIYSFEEIEVKQTPVSRKQFFESLKEYAELLNGRESITVMLTGTLTEAAEFLYLDKSIVMEVFENLMSNALRYAGSEVQITVTVDEESKLLQLSVADDGKGFSKEALIMAARPYYTEGRDKQSAHFGIGLYISRLLCEKHGGRLTFANRLEQGAIAAASFRIDERSKGSV